MMKNKITCLTDYKGVFGQKWNDVPYRSGMGRELLEKYFSENGYSIEFKKFSDVKFIDTEINGNVFLYTSSEDIGYHYKDFIEDVVLGIQEGGGIVIPEYKFLRSHNNKVFMEILRDLYLLDLNRLTSYVYGSLEEVEFNKINYPIVFKSAKGSMSQGVTLVKNKEELEKIIKKNCRTRNILKDFRDYIRKIKRKGYVRESLYRQKFILQEFVPNLSFDYKILIFGERFYIFQRPVRKDDFRASGSGFKNYIYGSKVNCPNGIFDYALNIYKKLNIPHLSIDVAYDGHKFYLFELQVLYFGTVGHDESDGYYYHSEGKWIFKDEKFTLEKVYSDSICYCLQNISDSIK